MRSLIFQIKIAIKKQGSDYYLCLAFLLNEIFLYFEIQVSCTNQITNFASYPVPVPPLDVFRYSHIAMLRQPHPISNRNILLPTR